MNYLIDHFKVLRLFVFAYAITTNAENNEASMKDNKSILFQEETLKITIYWLMEEMIKELMIW